MYTVYKKNMVMSVFNLTHKRPNCYSLLSKMVPYCNSKDQMMIHITYTVKTSGILNRHTVQLPQQ